MNAAAAMLSGAVTAASADPGISLTVGGGGSAPVKLFLLFTALSFASALLVSITSFTRIVIVLSFLRQALGTPQLPPNQVMIGLALVLSAFVMAPTANRVWTDGLGPYLDDRIQPAAAVDRAAEGWLTLNINAHDLPIDEPEQFYKDQSAGPLKDYPSIGNGDRETSYFLRMYLSCYRGADYLTTRPDWDGKTLVVTGGSQGGLQSIVTGAIFPKTTAIVACVPAGCDNSSLDVGRAPGWPMWPWWGKDEAAKAKIKATAPYFDVIHFATNVKCPALIGIGGIDTVCPSPGVYAAVNQMKGPVEVVFMPAADHMGKHDAYYARSGPWMNDLKQGKLPTSK